MKTFKLSIWHIILCPLFATLLFSCNKQNQFLDALPNENLAVPKTLADLQLMLNNDGLFNAKDPLWTQESSDDLYVSDSYYTREKASDPLNANIFVWAQDIYPNQNVGSPDWSYAYTQIYNANTILEALAKISPGNSQISEYNLIKGGALFFRAKAFYNLLQEFAKPYNLSTSSSDLGIPLRLSSDFNTKYPRSTVKDCYDQLIGDLKTSISLLPNTSQLITLPNKVAANGFLARVFLAMSDYNNAFSYADAYLSSNNTLTDYNTLAIGNYPISNTPLVEDVFHCVTLYGNFADFSNCLVDSTLYNSYDNNDLRKSDFFYQNLSFFSYWGTYDTIQAYSFNGIATDEIYLIRAECNARLGNVALAMKDLNTLLVNRYVTNTFVPRTATNNTDALKQILLERRKELIWRSQRWTDLRRLNQDPQFAITLKRVLNGVTYTLPPNDPRYTLPIPPQEIQLTGIPQNPR